jgi:hypothetical protein
VKLDDNIKKQIIQIRQEIRESKDLKEKSKDKAAIGKQYPSLNKPNQDDLRKINYVFKIK